ncbi:MAG: PAS domain-containing protein, partial [Cetobacterium sp.]
MSKEHFFENILENNQNGFMVLDRKKEIIYMNKQIVKMYEVEIKKNLNDYLKCGNTNCENVSCENTKGCKICVINKSIDRVIKFKKEEMLTEVVLNLDKKYIKLNCKIYLSDDFIVLEFLSLTEEEEKIQYITKILDHSHDLLFYKDSSLRYKYLNMSFANLFGKEKSEIYDKTDRDLLPEELYHQCLKGDLEVIEKGSYIGIEKFGDRDYKVLKELVDDGILGVVKDITEELKQTRLAETDSLTELYNRRKFLKMIDYIYENKINS